MSDTVTGVPELNYFVIKYLNPIYDKNEDLKAKFADVKLYVGFGNDEISQNYEYLFDMDDGNGGNPLPSSLFNVQTIQALVDLTSQVLDIVENPNAKTSEIHLDKL